MFTKKGAMGSLFFGGQSGGRGFSSDLYKLYLKAPSASITPLTTSKAQMS